MAAGPPEPGLSGEDYARIFAALPTAFLVLTPDLTVVGANSAYEASTGQPVEQIIGRYIFDAFPGNPDDEDSDAGLTAILTSFERARDTRRPDTMPLQKYDIPDQAGGFSERFWSVISFPVLDDDGQCVFVMQRPEDITDYVRERARGEQAREQSEAWHRRTLDAEADLFARGQELRAARDAEAAASQRVAALAGLALRLADAQAVEELTEIVSAAGLTVLGARGGAVAIAVAADEVLRAHVHQGLGDAAEHLVVEIPTTGRLPSSVAVTTGQQVLLPDEAASLAFAPEMADAIAATGCVAFAAVPMVAAERTLGSLLIGWREPQAFAGEDVGLLGAFAAQCAQALDRIQVRAAERETHDRIRTLAETLQHSLLTDPPRLDGLDIAVRYLPAAQQAQVGGDWYDAFQLRDGATVVVIGDVAGHDGDAAATMAQVRNVLRGVAHTLQRPPAAVLTALDQAMQDLDVGTLATAVLGRIEPMAGGACHRLTWSNAGHPPAVRIAVDGTTTLLDAAPDLLLGLDPTTPRADHELVIEAGDTVLLYTDGLVERRDSSLDDGFAWLRVKLGELAGLPPGELCDALLAEFVGRLEDDVALVAIRAAVGDERPAAVA